MTDSSVNTQQELEWQISLRNLEQRINMYRRRARVGAATEQEAEEVARAMENVGASHFDPDVRRHWRERTRAFRAADADERDGILEEIGKGFLKILTTPFMLVGAVLQAAGGILGGVASILKGFGNLTKKLSYTGSLNQRGCLRKPEEATE